MTNTGSKTMKRLSLTILLILMMCYLSSCSQKLPIPTSDGAGMLVIPLKSQNFTQYDYGYYYNFLYTPETQVQIKSVPLGSRKFAIINGFPPGEYKISGIRSISSANAGLADVNAETTDFSKPIPIQIRSNEITLLEYMFSVEQRLENTSNPDRYYQGYSFKPLNESQYEQIVGDLKNIPNAELWNLGKISATLTTDPDKGVTSVNQLFLTWRNWSRD
jgi:hypothetical protein